MRAAALTLLALLSAASTARAELVFLTTGRSLSVKSVEEHDGNLILHLRAGGEVVCRRELVAQIAPDEVPYPEPVEAPAQKGTLLAEPLTVANPYSQLIMLAAARHGIDARLLDAVIAVESGYQPRARSPKGAMGLMQLMPETARRFAVRRPFDPASNIEGGARYLRSLLDRYPLNLALAAYNAGEAAVERFQGIPPYQETTVYVARILQLVGKPADIP
jgi:soluble lytic murein transglycosylase-like protein